MNSSFDRAKEGSKDEWLTPPDMVRRVGPFDLDPCSPVPELRPWSTAAKHYCIRDDGLAQEWVGRVWCNPPYGRQTGVWLKRCADHGNAIALVFARTETSTFVSQVWERADGILFLYGRLKFYHVTGKRAASSAGAPSCLLAYGAANVDSLRKSRLRGALVIRVGGIELIEGDLFGEEE